MIEPVTIGRARLYLGDCRDILPTLPAEMLICTDPPYGIGFRYNSHDDAEEGYQELIAVLRGHPLALLQYPEEMMRLVCPVLGPPQEVLAWCYPSNLPRQFRLWGIWNASCDFSSVKQPARNPTDQRIVSYYDGPAMVSSYDWWEQPQVKNVSAEKTDHPCQIPSTNVERVIRLLGVQAFADPFLGSGTAGVVAARLGVDFVGIEKDPAYFDIACKRIEDAQRQGDLFIETAA